MDQKTIELLAERYAVSDDAVRLLWDALQKGNGAFAQFNHAELGGMGQWSSGGMTMIGDMFNTQLKERVNALSTELAGFLRANPSEFCSRSSLTPEHPDAWWGTGLGYPAANGSQNDMRYAYFPAPSVWRSRGVTASRCTTQVSIKYTVWRSSKVALPLSLS